jgi:dihydroxyacid dehydratase/phosphogluconate dehydratase
MEETYQLTSALKFLPFGRDVALVTDARFSGVSTGACIGHVSPEALAGGPLGRLVDGDLVRIVVDTRRLEASVDLVGHGDERWPPEEAERVLAARPVRDDVAPDPALPADTVLWARLQSVSGGLWGGCVYDDAAIAAALDAASPPAPVPSAAG